MREDPAEVAAALRFAIGQFMRRLRQVPVPGELGTLEMAALARLDRGGEAAPSELAHAEQVSPQAMGVTLAALAERGLVARRPDPDDGRRTIISLTEAGLELVRSKRGARTEQLAQALAGFSQQELAVLHAAAPLIERLGDLIR